MIGCDCTRTYSLHPAHWWMRSWWLRIWIVQSVTPSRYTDVQQAPSEMSHWEVCSMRTDPSSACLHKQ
jgi:hypothetical protein